MVPPRRGKKHASTIFVGREHWKRVFEDAVLNIPREGCALITWCGAGGQGKTALARELYRISSADEDPTYSFLRRGFLDLHKRSLTDADRLLVWLRNAFAEAGVNTPAFDLAFAVMWQLTRGDEELPKFVRPWLRRTTDTISDAHSDAVFISRDTLESLDLQIPILGLLIKQGVRWAFDKGKVAWIERSRQHLQALYRDGRLIEDYEMSELMPWMLAQDLNQHLTNAPEERFVLFVDEYERVTEGAGTGSRWRQNPFDDYMRNFIAETDGLLAIIFTREKLHWEEDAEWRDDLEDNQHLLGGLAEHDAALWLSKVPIEGETIRKAMIEGARETSLSDAPIFPLLLDLQVQHWRNLGSQATPNDFSVDAEEFISRRNMLVERLLRNYEAEVQDVLQRLCLSRRFDRITFEETVKKFNIPLSFATFDRIASLTLMEKGEDGWLTPHRAIADAISQSLNDHTIASSHSFLIEHFTARANPEQPKDVDEEALICLKEAAQLQFWHSVDGYVDWLAAAAETIQLAARATFLLPLWQEALHLTRSEFGENHPDTAASYNNVASNLDDQGRYDEAEPLYRKGLEIRREVLGENHPSTATSYNNVASNLNAQGRYDEAEPLYRKGLEIRRRVLGENHPDTATSYNNVAYNLNAQGRYDEAEPLYEHALTILRNTLPKDHPIVVLVASNLDACRDLNASAP